MNAAHVADERIPPTPSSGYWGLLEITTDYFGLLRITGDYLGLMAITKSYWGLLGKLGGNVFRES